MDILSLVPTLGTLVGVVLGASISGRMAKAKDMAVLDQAHKAERNTVTRELCVRFLESVDSETGAAREYEQRFGVWPGEDGHDGRSAKARGELTAMELSCPAPVFQAALQLVLALEGWAYGSLTDPEAVGKARERFVNAVHVDA